jgi:hypothetical protein
MHEYSCLFPNMAPLNNKFREIAETEQLLNELQQRLGTKFDINKGSVVNYLFFSQIKRTRNSHSSLLRIS